MKKILLFAIITLAFRQVSNSQTTAVEYNYVTSGLQDDLSKGKDLKSGYRLEDSGISTTITWQGARISSRTAKIYYFKKTATNKTVALVIECKDSKDNLKYRCLPTKDASEELWNRAYEAIAQDNDWLPVYTWVFAKFLATKSL
jgi:hypothetical protein